MSYQITKRQITLNTLFSGRSQAKKAANILLDYWIFLKMQNYRSSKDDGYE